MMASRFAQMTRRFSRPSFEAAKRARISTRLRSRYCRLAREQRNQREPLARIQSRHGMGLRGAWSVRGAICSLRSIHRPSLNGSRHSLANLRTLLHSLTILWGLESRRPSTHPGDAIRAQAPTPRSPRGSCIGKNHTAQAPPHCSESTRNPTSP